MKKVTLFVLFVIGVAGVADGQVRTFKWADELCEFEGSYDSRRYSETKLRNTLRLVQPGEFDLNANATVWKYSDIEGLDVEQLDRNYKALREHLVSLDIVASPYWEAARQARLRELDQVYRLSRVTMLAYRRPEVLSEYPDAEACKTRFAAPIATGGEKLLEVWEKVNIESRSRNADPDRLKRKFEAELRSPERLEFALVETMAFGWWNCANEFIQYDTAASDGSRDREFRKLFRSVNTLSCDEP